MPWWRNCCCCCCWVWALIISFCLLSSSTFRCELECLVRTNVGLAAGRYSGTSLPDLYLTPQALHSVFGPIGPVLHCGVLYVAQWRHFLTSPPPLMAILVFSQPSFFLGFDFAAVFLPPPTELVAMSDWSEHEDIVDVVVVVVVVAVAAVAVGMTGEGETTRSLDVQLHGAARERLLRALAGTAVSGRNIIGWWSWVTAVAPPPSRWWFGSDRWNSSSSWWVSGDGSLLFGDVLIPDIKCNFCKSSLENESSTKFDSHSNSANSSYYPKKKTKNQNQITVFLNSVLIIYFLFIILQVWIPC